MAVTQHPRQGRVDATVERGMAELVEHRVLPALAGHDIGEQTHVARAIDVDAERVLAFPLAREEITALEHRMRLEPDAVEGQLGEGDGVTGGEQGVDVDATLDRYVLEERVGVVPRRELGDRASEPGRQPIVDASLPACERLAGGAVDLGQRRKEPLLVHLGSGEGEGEPVAVANGTRCLVPEARKHAHVVRDSGTDRLRGFPRLATPVDIVALAENPQDLVVVDPPAGDDSAMD